jgi:hypothetical protein
MPSAQNSNDHRIHTFFMSRPAILLHLQFLVRKPFSAASRTKPAKLPDLQPRRCRPAEAGCRQDWSRKIVTNE